MKRLLGRLEDLEAALPKAEDGTQRMPIISSREVLPEVLEHLASVGLPPGMSEESGPAPNLDELWARVCDAT